MTKTKYAPGPWKIEGNHITTANGSILAIGLNTLQNKFNVRLITAAPELLEALEGCLAIIDEHMPNNSEPCQSARAAIAKATGDI